MRVFRLLLTAAALSALSATAEAGPIRFTYRIEAEHGPSADGGGEFAVNHRSPPPLALPLALRINRQGHVDSAEQREDNDAETTMTHTQDG